MLVPRSVIALVLAIFVLSLVGLTDREMEVLAPRDTSAQLAFGGSQTLGQEFKPEFGLRAIRIPLGMEEDARGPLLLHIRREYLGEDLRTAAVFDVADGAAEFKFDSILWPPSKLLWVLEAPHSFEGSYWVYREVDATAFPDGKAFVKNKLIKGNFAFTAVSRQLRFMGAWREWREALQSWELYSLGLGVGAALLVAVGWRHVRVKTEVVIIGLIIAGTIARLFLASRFPAVIDEGAYLMDAWQSNWDFLPFRDFLTKGPLYIIILKTWQLFVPNSLEAMRSLSVVAWGAATWFTARIAKELGVGAKGQIVTAAAMSILPGAVALTVPLLLQVVSTALAVLGIWFTVRFRGSRLFSGSGSAIALAAAFLTRVSSVAAIIAAAGMLLAQKRWQTLGAALIVGSAVLGASFVVGVAVIGFEATAVMFNLEAFLISADRASVSAEVEPLIRDAVIKAEILWRSAPWLLAAVVCVPLVLMRRLLLWERVVLSGVWSVVMYQIVLVLLDVGWRLPGVYPGGRFLIVLIVVVLPIWLLVRNLTAAQGVVMARGALGLSAVWLGLLWTLYYVWGGFQQAYWVEFLPPLALATGWVVSHVWTTRMSRRHVIVFGGLLAASLVYGWILVLRHPHTGTVELSSLDDVARVVKREVPEGKAIFTAQPLVTALAQRPIVFGYSHPGWIRAARVGNVPDELRRLYFANDLEISQHLTQHAEFVLDDERTREIYFEGFPERQEILNQYFVLVAEIENSLSEEPFRLYERRDPTRSRAE